MFDEACFLIQRQSSSCCILTGQKELGQSLGLLFFLFFFFNSYLVDLQHCVSLRCMAQWWSYTYICLWGFPGSSAGKVSACNAGDWVQSLGLERSPGEGKVYSLQCSSLENSMGSQRVGHSWATFTTMYVYMYILFQILFLYSLLENIRNSSLCYSRSQLVTCFPYRSTYMLIQNS